MEAMLVTEQVAALLRRAAAEPAFLAALLQDTAATLAREGVAFPPWLQLQRLEGGQPLFVLKGLAQSGELADQDLELVAGGKSQAWKDYHLGP